MADGFAGIGLIGGVTHGDCVEGMSRLPEGSVDLVFADPPYNLTLGGDELRRPDQTRVRGVREAWDSFADLRAYDDFTRSWLGAARRVMAPNATIAVMGSYHNVFRIGSILQDLGFWILNDIVWVKENPMPNFRGRRFTNAHETMIWAARSSDSVHTLNYELLKSSNEDRQMRSDWVFPICGGNERLRGPERETLHPTQKPLALVRRLVTAASMPGELVLDPFAGSGTTGVVAREMGRRFVGFERDAGYVAIARDRVAASAPLAGGLLVVPEARRLKRRVPFLAVVEAGLLEPGAVLTCPAEDHGAVVRPDGNLGLGDFVGSIHQVGARAARAASCNGWSYWHYREEEGRLPIDELRKALRERWAA